MAFLAALLNNLCAKLILQVGNYPQIYNWVMELPIRRLSDAYELQGVQVVKWTGTSDLQERKRQNSPQKNAIEQCWLP